MPYGTLWDDLDYLSDPMESASGDESPIRTLQSPIPSGDPRSPRETDLFGRATRGGSLSSWWTSRVAGFSGLSWSARQSGADTAILRMARALKTAARIGRLALGELSARDFSFTTREARDSARSHHVAVDVSAARMDPDALHTELGWDEERALDAAVGSALAEGTLATFASRDAELRDPTGTWRGRSEKLIGRRLGAHRSGSEGYYRRIALFHAAELFRDAAAPVAARAAGYDSFPGFDGYHAAHAEYLRRPSLLEEVRNQALAATNTGALFAAHAFAAAGAALADDFLEPGAPVRGALSDPDLAEAVARDLRTRMGASRDLDAVADAVVEAALRLQDLLPDDDTEAMAEAEQLQQGQRRVRLQPRGDDDDDAAEEADAMAERDLRDETESHARRQPNFRYGERDHVVPVWSARAPVDEETTRAYLESRARVMALAGRTREALAFRNEQAFFDDRPLMSGHVDPGAAHKLALGDVRIFARREIEEPPRVVVGVLIDESGSMSANAGFDRTTGRYLQRYDVARDCAVLLHEALRHERGVVLKVWGHDTSFGKGAMVHRYEQPEALGHIGARAANLDGAAIGFCVEEIRRLAEQQAVEGRPAEGVLFVLCDGYPSGGYEVDGERHGYSGMPAFRHTRAAVDLGRRHGFSVIGLGMGSGLDERGMEQCFGPGGFELVPDVPELPVRLQRAVVRALRRQGAAGA